VFLVQQKLINFPMSWATISFGNAVIRVVIYLFHIWMSKPKLLYDWRSVNQYVLVTSPLWDLRPDITSFQMVAVWNLLYCLCGAASLTRGQVCSLQCNHSMVRVAQNPIPYFTVSSESTPTWRARFPYLYPPRTGWSSYAPGHWVPFTSPLTTSRATVEIF
jgi:hypothetical protein